MSLVRVNLLYMSVSGGILILVTAFLRKLFGDRLPGRSLPVLWCIVLLRLLLPLSMSFPAAVFPLTWQQAGNPAEAGGGIAYGEWTGRPGEMTGRNEGYWTGGKGSGTVGRPGETDTGGKPDNAGYPGAGEAFDKAGYFRDVAGMLQRIAAAGTLICAAVFLIMYLSCLRLFASSVPVERFFVKQWVQRNRPGRRVEVRQSDRIASPLTYGLLRPVILLPGNLEGEDEGKLAYILQHEMVHVRRLDGSLKLMMAAALCLHWFNPLVWVMYRFLNRDIELACDEKVLEICGEGARKGYAMTLIGMEERKSASVSLLNGFGKNAVEERVGAIMKYNKKKKGILAGTAAVLIFAAAFAFAISVRAGGGQETEGLNPENHGEDDSIVMDPPGNPAGIGLSRTTADLDAAGASSVQDGQGKEGAQGEQPDRGAGGTAAEAGDAAGSTPVQGSGTDTGEVPEVPKLFPGMDYASEEEDQYQLTYMLEGMEETEPAWLVYGEGYCALIPKGDWKMSAPEEWVSEVNSSVTFRVVHFSEEGSEYHGQSRDQIAEAYTALGYQPMYTEYQLYRQEDDITDVVEIRSSGGDVWGVCYTYPSEAEEGFGVKLRAMAQHLGILPLNEEKILADQMGVNEMIVARETMLIILEICQGKDPEGLSPYLSSSFDEGDLEILGILTECTVEEVSMRLNPSSGAVISSVPVRTTESDDSIDYLTLELVKEDGEWKLVSMGLEK